MKPPWKYLAQLVSRQRCSETSDETSAPGSARRLVEIELQSPATILLSSPEATPVTEQVDESEPKGLLTAPTAIDSEIDPETLELPPDFTEVAKAEVTEAPEQSNSGPLVQRRAEEAVVQLPKLRQAKLKTAKKDRVGPQVEITDAITDLAVPATSSPADTFFDRATSLDDDIKQLKDLLAQKLRMQNAQLGAMLGRFERP
jgi:hypothetical protein